MNPRQPYYTPKHEIPADLADPSCNWCGYSSHDGPYSGELCPACLSMVDWQASFDETMRTPYCGTYSPGRLAPVPRYPECGLAERVYVKFWEKRNTPSPGVNGGVPTLFYLRGSDFRELQHGRDGRDIFGHPRSDWEETTYLEEKIAASVIQWLGTNCGQAFIYECEREIERRRVQIRAAKSEEHKRRREQIREIERRREQIRQRSGNQ